MASPCWPSLIPASGRLAGAGQVATGLLLPLVQDEPVWPHRDGTRAVTVTANERSHPLPSFLWLFWRQSRCCHSCYIAPYKPVSISTWCFSAKSPPHAKAAWWDCSTSTSSATHTPLRHFSFNHSQRSQAIIYNHLPQGSVSFLESLSDHCFG